MSKPHCYGAMTWILKYDNDKIPKHSICDCSYKNSCLELTLNPVKEEEFTTIEIKLKKKDVYKVIEFLNSL